MKEIKEHWQEILKTVGDEMEQTTVSFNTWMAPLTPVSLDHDVLTVVLRMITREDMALIPGGDKLARLLHMR